MTARTASTPGRWPAAGPQISDADLCINALRTLAIHAAQKGNSGHAGNPMALAPIVYRLWQEFPRYNPADPLWPNRDRSFAEQVLSAMRRGFGGHIEPDKAAQP